MVMGEEKAMTFFENQANTLFSFEDNTPIKD